MIRRDRGRLARATHGNRGIQTHPAPPRVGGLTDGGPARQVHDNWAIHPRLIARPAPQRAGSFIEMDTNKIKRWGWDSNPR